MGRGFGNCLMLALRQSPNPAPSPCKGSVNVGGAVLASVSLNLKELFKVCIIIHSPTGAIEEEQLKRSLFVNNDGWGFAIALGEQLHVRKGLSPITFWAAWEDTQKTMAGLPILFHARIRTQGKIKVDNCHPFQVADDWVMAHNGCIWKMGDKNQSDTAQLAGIIRAVGPNAFMTEEGRLLLKEVIGTNDKLVFLHSSGMSVKVNGGFGHENDGNWYSNYSYKNYQNNTQVPVVWKSSSTVVAAPTYAPALGAPGKKTKPRFQEEDISHLPPEFRKLRADIIVRSALNRQKKKNARSAVAMPKVTGLAATTTENGGLQCERGIVFDDMSGPSPIKHGKYYDWDSLDESDWKREAAKMRALEGDSENMKIRIAD